MPPERPAADPARPAGGRWLWIGKPLRPPLRDGSTVLAADLSRAMPDDVDLAYLGDPEQPARPGDRVLPAAPMGYAPTLGEKLRVLRILLDPAHRDRGVHFFFTPNRVTSTVVRALRRLWPRRLLVQSVMSSDGAAGWGPWLTPMDRVVTLSEHTRRVLVESAGVDADRVRCIYPGVALPDRLAPLPPRPTALYAGDLDPSVAERLVALGRALPAGARLVIAARPKGERDAEARALLTEALAGPIAAGDVEVHAEVADMGALMDACSVQVFLADHLRRKVDLPLVLLEGLARGRGLVCADLPSLREIFAAAGELGVEAGVAVAVDGVAAAAAAALTDPARLRRWSDGARELACARFDRARMAQEVAQLYRECEARRDGAGAR